MHTIELGGGYTCDGHMGMVLKLCAGEIIINSIVHHKILTFSFNIETWHIVESLVT